MDGGAYGFGKATGVFDPIAFVKRPPVITKLSSLFLALVIFGCISSQGWLKDTENPRREICLYHGNSTACNFGSSVSVIGFIACCVLLAGEYVFEQTSSVKTRKHFVLADLGFSGFWAFIYFIAFCYLADFLGKADVPPSKYGADNASSAVFFSFLAICTWGGNAYLAYQRYLQGVDANFCPNYDANVDASASYGSYPMGPEADQQYQQPPFAQQPTIGVNEYQQATY